MAQRLIAGIEIATAAIRPIALPPIGWKRSQPEPGNQFADQIAVLIEVPQRRSRLNWSRCAADIGVHVRDSSAQALPALTAIGLRSLFR